MSHAQMGELRSLLASPSQENWSALCELLAAWDDLDALREAALPYAERALRDWPDAIWRDAPPAWLAMDAALPLYRLTRPLTASLVPWDQALWAQAVAATEDQSGEGATQTPKSFADVLTDTYPGTMRANALAAAHYLSHGLKLAPTSWTIPGGTYASLVHHGALHVTGDYTFTRAPSRYLATLITGTLQADGTVGANAFEGELMVGGELRAGALICDADLAVGGDIICDYVRLAWYDCAWGARSVQAQVVIEHGMDISDAPIDARLHLACEDHDTSLQEDHEALLEEALTPALYAALFVDDEEDDDLLSVAYSRLDAVIGEALLRGEQVFQDAP